MDYSRSKFNSIIAVVLLLVIAEACSPNNVIVDDSLKKYFDANKVTGTFALFDNGQGKFTIYNVSRYKDSAYLPASTFKIVNSLIGLKTGVVFNEQMVIKWDGKVRKFPNGNNADSWNKDLTIEQAFKASSFSHYQEIAKRIGKDTMQLWLDSLQYGNRKIGNHIDSFWVDNSLKVTPDEQLGLVKKLYFEQLPIDKRPQRIVKKLMLQESNTNYQLSYKTGWGFRENGNAIGWIVGWIEENHHPYFFVLNVEGPHNTNMYTIRLNILKAILKQWGFLEGKK